MQWSWKMSQAKPVDPERAEQLRLIRLGYYKARMARFKQNNRCQHCGRLKKHQESTVRCVPCNLRLRLYKNMRTRRRKAEEMLSKVEVCRETSRTS